MAEEANQLYRDSGYNDLISFEEDVAKLAAMVLLIAESPGSLAELGAFASLSTTRSKLAILMQTTFEGRESFIRFGPIRRIQSDDHQRVRFYPWKTNLKGLIVKTSTRPHVKPMVDAINKLLKSSSKEEGFKVATGVQDFFIILWVMHLAQATPFESLYDFVARIQPIERSDLRNKLYCMKLAGWINVYPYGGEAYWYTTSPDDPFTKYSFNTGVATNDPLRRKFEVSRSLREHLNTPRQVGRFVESTKPVSL